MLWAIVEIFVVYLDLLYDQLRRAPLVGRNRVV